MIFPVDNKRRLRELKYLQEQLSECLVLMEKQNGGDVKQEQNGISIVEFEMSISLDNKVAENAKLNELSQEIDYDYIDLKNLVNRLSTIKSRQNSTTTLHKQFTREIDDEDGTGDFDDYKDIIDLTSDSLYE